MITLARVSSCVPAAVSDRGHLSASWIDDVLTDSFPASDPPSWTPGMARPAPTHELNEHEAASFGQSSMCRAD